MWLNMVLLWWPSAAIAPSFIRGVNLGSTFIPENWMVPSFYAGTGTTSLCSLVRLNHTLAAERMRQHLASFVVESDFSWLASHGFNAVRIPLGYWNALGAEGLPGSIHESTIPYVPSTAAESFEYLDRMFSWANEYGLSVFLDLHGAPGSQNGADHSGCDHGVGRGDGIGWGLGSTVKRSLAAIEVLAKRYGKNAAFLGIELLNEPSWAVEWNHALLLEYYVQGLKIVRASAPTALVAFNVLYWRDFPAGFGDWWNGQLVDDENIVMDLHLYDCYDEASGKTIEEHKEQARAWGEAIEKFKAHGHKILVGEWSLATGVHPGGQEWADAQLQAFSSSRGWFFWSLKKENLGIADDDGGDTWSLRGVLRSGIHGLGDAQVESSSIGDTGAESARLSSAAVTSDAPAPIQDLPAPSSHSDSHRGGAFLPAVLGRVQEHRPWGDSLVSGGKPGWLLALCLVFMIVLVIVAMASSTTVDLDNETTLGISSASEYELFRPRA